MFDSQHRLLFTMDYSHRKGNHLTKGIICYLKKKKNVESKNVTCKGLASHLLLIYTHWGKNTTDTFQRRRVGLMLLLPPLTFKCSVLNFACLHEKSDT